MSLNSYLDEASEENSKIMVQYFAHVQSRQLAERNLHVEPVTP